MAEVDRPNGQLMVVVSLSLYSRLCRQSEVPKTKMCGTSGVLENPKFDWKRAIALTLAWCRRNCQKPNNQRWALKGWNNHRRLKSRFSIPNADYTLVYELPGVAKTEGGGGILNLEYLGNGKS